MMSWIAETYPKLNLLTYLFTYLLKVAYYSFIRVQEVYTINVQI